MRVNMARGWQRWHQLGRRVRPVLGDTCLVSLQDEASTLRREGRAMSGHGQRSEGLDVSGEVDVGDVVRSPGVPIGWLADMGSLIKKRRKRMRKKKHKKMLKRTRWQRRAAGK